MVWQTIKNLIFFHSGGLADLVVGGLIDPVEYDMIRLSIKRLANPVED